MIQKQNDQKPEFLVIKEVADLFRLSTSAIRVMEKNGEIPSYRYGKKIILFKRDEVLNLLKPKNHE